MSPDDLEALIAARRSNILIDQSEPVDPVVVERIVSAAQWAPNHKRTWPLRVAIVTGDSRGHLGSVIADAMALHGDDDAKVTKARTKYLRAPVIIVVAAAEGTSPTETEENRHAVAAGTQNMLLMCESFGLAALWGSPPKGANEAVTTICRFDTTDHVMGLIYVGWPSRVAEVVDRPPMRITRLD